MGQSCGGLQALAVSHDPRITTTVVWNSGALPPGSSSPALKQSAGNKDSLNRLHGPVAYFIGGPTDVAYPNAEDDFARISKVPVFKANLNVGHGGTYRQPGGGRFGEVAVAWLDYQLKGSAEAAKWFVGVDCRLVVRDPLWAIEKNGMRYGEGSEIEAGNFDGRRSLWPVSVVLVACAPTAVGIGRVAAQQTAPSAAACTALDAAMFTAVATLTTTYDAGSAAQPAHCVVRGSAAPRTGVDGKAYETRFELRLPTDWSGRFLYQGGGGNDGIVAPAVGRNTGSFPDTGLQRGFAVVTTDAGHQGGTPEFGLDPVARVDHAYAAHERTATIAFAIVSRYYGRAPDRKYFVGCSGGGRQGMMFAQRYPAYFDGIAICAPAMSVSSGATIAAAWDTQTYLSIAPTNEQGQRVLSRAFSDADLALVARGVTTACDAADGAVDGMVLRPEACRFDPKRLQCAGAKDANCLTSEQVAALERTFGGPRDSAGRALYVGQLWDPGIATPGWRQWKLGTSPTSTPNAVNTTLMAGALAYEFFTPPDPSFSIARFDFDRDPARMEAFSAVYDTYRDATLAEFRSAAASC